MSKQTTVSIVKIEIASPGPWRIGALESGQAAVDSASGAEVTGWVSIPDARLISAAPDMLSALEAIAPMLPHGVDNDPQWAAAINAVRAAIKKARGDK
jgi:hypothetical protein